MGKVINFTPDEETDDEFFKNATTLLKDQEIKQFIVIGYDRETYQSFMQAHNMDIGDVILALETLKASVIAEKMNFS